MDKQGLLLCARYAAAPNFFGYCGPDENKSLVDHLKDNIADREVFQNLSEFETLYPYLQLIARENKISDPFDNWVVEAYWLGNKLLENVQNNNYLNFLKEKFKIEKKIDKFGFLPHHAFHVFNIFKRTGKDPSFHTIETMDSCRISWGRIKIKNSESRIQNLIVKTKQLTIKHKQLFLKQFVMKEIKIDYKNKIFLHNLHVGDWVSFHWGMVCDRLTDQQVKNLEYYTQKAINFYNSHSGANGVSDRIL